jgi:hypothetical protein
MFSPNIELCISYAFKHAQNNDYVFYLGRTQCEVIKRPLRRGRDASTVSFSYRSGGQVEPTQDLTWFDVFRHKGGFYERELSLESQNENINVHVRNLKGNVYACINPCFSIPNTKGFWGD